MDDDDVIVEIINFLRDFRIMRLSVALGWRLVNIKHQSNYNEQGKGYNDLSEETNFVETLAFRS